MAQPNLASIWEALQREAEAGYGRLTLELESAWKDLAAVLHSQAGATSGSALEGFEAGKIASIRALTAGPGGQLLLDTVASLRRIRAQDRALAAMDTNRASVEDLVGRLPQTISVSLNELSGILGIRPPILSRGFRLGGLHKPRQLPIRRIVELHFLEDAAPRASRQGAYFLVLAQASLLALSTWQDLRREALRMLAGQGTRGDAASQSHSRRLEQAQNLDKRAAAVLAELRAWKEGASARLARSLLRARTRRSSRHAEKLSLWRQKCFQFWSRQQRAVTAVWALASEFNRLTIDLADAAGRALTALDREQAQLVNELDLVIQWLERVQTSELRGDFPPASAKLASADDRVAEWQRVVEAAARIHLPLRVETIEPRWNLPPGSPPWRLLEPQESFLRVLNRLGRQKILEGFREAEGGHRAIVREIERAREVVTFSLETARSEGIQGLAIAREGMANALSLVSFQKETAIDPHPAVEAKLVEGTASTLIFTHLALEQRRLGILTRLVRESGSAIAVEGARLLAERTSVAGGQVSDFLSGQYHGFLRRIGWEAPAVAAVKPVITRPYFDEIFKLQLGGRDLPMIYRRLFRLAPVEEPRFLVGREAELTALASARAMWQSDRAVSVLLVGARGSGKTSLLNCAITLEYPDVPVLRSEFQERITSPREMRRFLHRLFQVPDEEDLVKALKTRKTVVMLEELERTFLRSMGGFDGLRELLSIISSTARTTLWILSINQHSYRYLDAAVGMGQYFSHRINATAVAKEHLANAILLRHHLSGLRLQYPPIPASDPRVSQVRRLLGLQHSTEELFFDSLYSQSEGIFRSAFELWQHFIERVEGGVLYLREPTEPAFEPMIAQLTLEDAFALQVILQHGNLTDRDHAAIFECPLEQSRIRLERLLALELLEPEPGSTGFRIRPEAGHVVHIALHRLNLV